MDKRRKNAGGGNAGTSAAACAPPATTLLALLQDEAIYRLIMGAAVSQPEHGQEAAGLRASCRALRDLVDGRAEAINITEKCVEEMLSGNHLLPRLPRLQAMQYTFRGQQLPLLNLLAASPRNVSSFKFVGMVGAAVPRLLPCLGMHFGSSLQTLDWSQGRLEAEDYQCLGQMRQLKDLRLTSMDRQSALAVAPLAQLTSLTRFDFLFNTGAEEEQLQDLPCPAWEDVLPALSNCEEAGLDSASLDTLLLLGALPKLQTATVCTHLDPLVAGQMRKELLAGAEYASLERLTLCIYEAAQDAAPRLQQLFNKMGALKHVDIGVYRAGACLPALQQLPETLERLGITLLAKKDRVGELMVPELNDPFFVSLSRHFLQLQSLTIVAVQRHKLSDAGIVLAAPLFRSLQSACYDEADYEDDDGAFKYLGGVTMASAAVFASAYPSVKDVALGLPAADAHTRSQMRELLDQTTAIGQRCIKPCTVDFDGDAIQKYTYFVDELW